jgi:hypothetical protein
MKIEILPAISLIYAPKNGIVFNNLDKIDKKILKQ